MNKKVNAVNMHNGHAGETQRDEKNNEAVQLKSVVQLHYSLPQHFLPFIKASLIFLLSMGLPVQVLADVSVDRQQALRHMLKQDCGSCHGMTLKGGLGPALTADVIATKPKPLLLTTILDGRPGTPMPPFRGLLSEEEVHWLVELLYKGDV